MAEIMLATTRLNPADYFILIAYFSISLGIGAYFYRKMRGMKGPDDLGGNRTLADEYSDEGRERRLSE